MNQYLIEEWTEEGKENKYRFVTGEVDLFRIINEAKDNNLRIVVFKVGVCLLDWS